MYRVEAAADLQALDPDVDVGERRWRTTLVTSCTSKLDPFQTFVLRDIKSVCLVVVTVFRQRPLHEDGVGVRVDQMAPSGAVGVIDAYRTIAQ